MSKWEKRHVDVDELERTFAWLHRVNCYPCASHVQPRGLLIDLNSSGLPCNSHVSQKEAPSRNHQGGLTLPRLRPSPMTKASLSAAIPIFQPHSNFHNRICPNLLQVRSNLSFSLQDLRWIQQTVQSWKGVPLCPAGLFAKLSSWTSSWPETAKTSGLLSGSWWCSKST